MAPTQHSNHEHPLDVFEAAINATTNKTPYALAFVVDTQGGSVRRRGAVMLIYKNGDRLGYVSGGCIDADVSAQAVEAISHGRSRRIKYGTGSQFLDLKLPCGGTIILQIIVNPNIKTLQHVTKTLQERKQVTLFINDAGDLHLEGHGNDFKVTYHPKLNIRLAGRGHDVIALAKLAASSGISVKVQCPDLEYLTCLNGAVSPERVNYEHLLSSTILPAHQDDNYTAFILMFHDMDWEVALLTQALDGEAFYVGAVGSRKTHARRCEALLNAGVSIEKIESIKGPIGLVPSMRDSSTLAISILAEVIQVFHERYT